MKRIKVGTEADVKVQAIKKKIVKLRVSKGYLLKNPIALKRNEQLKQQLRETFKEEGEEKNNKNRTFGRKNGGNIGDR